MDLSKELSPQERQRKELEMAILGSRLVTEKQNQELQGLQIQDYRNRLKQQQDDQGNWNKRFEDDTPDDQPTSDKPDAAITPTATTFAPVQPNRFIGSQYDPDSPIHTITNPIAAPAADSSSFAALPDTTDTTTLA